MSLSVSNSPSYALTIRIEYPNSVGMLGQVTSIIGEYGGDIGAVDIVQTERQAITRDISFAAADVEHGQEIVAAVRAIPHIDVVQVSDRTFLTHLGGKLEIHPKVTVKSRDDLSLVYIPGVTRIAQAIVDDPNDVFNLSIKRNTIAIVSDGSELLGLGNTGPLAALPVMESKAILHKEFAGTDAFPLCLDVANIDELVAAVKATAPAFGAIHLEDIASPACFEIERRLTDELDIPVWHNDQHGTAIVILAALINALRLVEKEAATLKVVIHRAGATGIATARLLMRYGIGDVVVCDENGVLHAGRAAEFENSNAEVAALARNTNPRGLQGSLRDALKDADVFIGFGRQRVLEPEDIATMAASSIVFMMAYPQPEVELNSIVDIATITASGRSDFPNQINNMLCFPGFFRGLLEARAARVTEEMKLAAATAIADVIARDELDVDYIIPGIFDRRVVKAVAEAVTNAAKQGGVARRTMKPLKK